MTRIVNNIIDGSPCIVPRYIYIRRIMDENHTPTQGQSSRGMISKNKQQSVKLR